MSRKNTKSQPKRNTRHNPQPLIPSPTSHPKCCFTRHPPQKTAVHTTAPSKNPRTSSKHFTTQELFPPLSPSKSFFTYSLSRRALPAISHHCHRYFNTEATNIVIQRSWQSSLTPTGTDGNGRPNHKGSFTQKSARPYEAGSNDCTQQFATASNRI